MLETEEPETQGIGLLGKKLAPKDSTYKVLKSDNPEDKNKISFDFLARTIVEIFVEDKVKEMERIYINLKVQNTSRHESRISFDDFHYSLTKSMPEKSSRWIEICYKKFLKHSQNTSTQLHLLFQNIITALEDKGIEENFYIPKIEFVDRHAEDEIIKSLPGKKLKDRNEHAALAQRKLVDGKGDEICTKNAHFSVLLYDPFTSIISSKLQYRALENLIENEQTKKEKILITNEEVSKIMLRNPISNININQDDYSQLDTLGISNNAQMLARKLRGLFATTFNN